MVSFKNRKIILAGYAPPKKDINEFIEPFQKLIEYNQGTVVVHMIQHEEEPVNDNSGFAPVKRTGVFVGREDIDTLKDTVKRHRCNLILFVNKLSEKQIELIADKTRCEVEVLLLQ